MRARVGKFTNAATIGNVTRGSLIAFSTSAGGGGGGGRGRGRGSSSSGHPQFQFTFPAPEPNDDPKGDDSHFPPGMGHGRGKPLPSTPSFFNVMSDVRNRGIGRGRGLTPPPQSEPLQRSPSEPEHSGPKRPIFFLKDDAADSPSPRTAISGLARKPDDSNLPSSILSVLSGAGRGKPVPPAASEEKPKEENRHLRHQQPGRGRGPVSAQSSATPRSQEEAVRNAVGILSRTGGGSEESGRGRGFGNRGRRGRGRGVRGRGRRRGREGQIQDEGEDYGAGLYLGDDADGEKLAKRIGPDNMAKLEEAFDEMSSNVLPSPMQDAYLDALHTNFLLECEPEYLMEEFGTNPDIDEKPPISLLDALEKMKPFLMAYEGIQSQEEWEEVVKETMERVPIMKELVDYYSGPDRVTAKKQHEELKRIAKTLPESAPTSVKRFTDRAVHSLQSNPGWGFDKKCQFMDKLVWEVSQQYK